MTDAPAPSGDFTLERAQELIELIAELPVKNTYERIIALQHDALAAERERVKALTVEWKDANANWVRHRKAAEIAEARATAAEAQVREMREMLAKAALCFSALAGDGISTTENGDPADIYFEIGALLGLDANSDTAEWDNDFRATLAATKAEG